MATPETSTTYDALIREMWPQNDIYDEILQPGGLLALLPKDTTFTEKIRHIVVGYGANQGQGASYTGAKAAQGVEVEAEFQVTDRSYYTFFSIDRKLKKRAKLGGKKALIVDAIERKSRNALLQWRVDMSRFLYGTGVGDIGRISSVATTTVTLATAMHHRNFDKNLIVDISSDNTGVAGLRSSTGTPLTVSRVVRSGTTSQVVFTGNVSASFPAAAANDYLYKSSNYNSVLIGLGKQLPSADPTAGDSLYSLDRSADPQRLAGVRTDASGLSPREQALLVAKDVNDANGGLVAPDTYVIGSDAYYNLQLELQSAGAMLMTKVPAANIGSMSFGIEYDAVQFMGPKGKIKVICDTECPADVGYLLALETWTLASMGPLVDWDRKGHPSEDSDDEEWMAAGDTALYCEAPVCNGRAALA